MMRTRARRWGIAALLTAAAGLAVDVPVASAQGRVPSTGIFGGGPPPDPNRARQEFTLTTNLLAGYDDNLVIGASGGGTTPPTGPEASGYLGDAQVDMEYFRGRADRSFSINGGAHGTRYSESSVGFQSDASLRVSGVTRLRRRDQFRVDGILTYDSYSTLGAFEGLEPALGIDALPTSTPDARLTQTSSVGGQALLNYLWTVGRHDSVDLQYSFATRRYDERAAESPGDVDTHHGTIAYSRTLGRWSSIRTSYDYSNAESEDRLGTLPVVEHTITAGPVWARQLSRTRRLEVSASAGAQYVETVTRDDEAQDIQYWVPAGSASVRLDLGRSWAVWSDYSHDTTVLPQVTTTALTSDAVSLSAGGRLGSRFGLSFTTGLARGDSSDATGGTDEYSTVLAGTQAQWRVNRRVATTLTYTYYRYEFGEATNLPVGFLPASSRNAIRVGVTIWLPLLGGYLAEPIGRP